LSGRLTDNKKTLIEVKRAERKKIQEVLKIQRQRKKEMDENKKNHI